MNRSILKILFLYLFFYSKYCIAVDDAKENNEVVLSGNNEEGDNSLTDKVVDNDLIVLNNTEMRMYINIYNLYSYFINVILEDISIDHPLMSKDDASKLFGVLKENFSLVQSLINFSKMMKLIQFRKKNAE